MQKKTQLPQQAPIRIACTKNIKIPPYYLSVVAQNLSERKQKWALEKKRGLPPRKVVSWSAPKPTDASASLIVKIDANGRITHVTHSGLAHGTLLTKSGLLSAQHGHIRLYSRDLKNPRLFASLNTFNDVHTLRKTPRGILIVASGTDSIYEISRDGKKVLWSWFASDHGFEIDSYGKKRVLDKKADHRSVWYTVWQHTTHINSALPFDANSVLATFFHQGILGKIDRASGAVTTIFSGMKRPHAARWSGDYITFVDTVRGIAYRGTIEGAVFKEEHSVRIESNWLQDAQFVDNMWILVDAEHARIHFLDRNNKVLAIDQFNPDWDFFEVTCAT